MHDYNYIFESMGEDMSQILLYVTIFGIVLGLIMLISLWKIFKKANQAGWKALVPIYNYFVLLKITELPSWYMILFFIPLANVYLVIKVALELAHKFGKGTGFSLALIFFPVIAYPILAFGRSAYKGNREEVTNNFANIKQNPDLIPQVFDNPVHVDQDNIKKPVLDVQPISKEIIGKSNNNEEPHQTFGIDAGTGEEPAYKLCPKCRSVVKGDIDTCFMCGHKF